MALEKLVYFFSLTNSLSKIFIPNFVCILTNKIYKTYQMGFHCVTWFKHPGVGLGVLGGGGGGGQKFNFSEQGHVAYQIEGDYE